MLLMLISSDIVNISNSWIFIYLFLALFMLYISRQV